MTLPLTRFSASTGGFYPYPQGDVPDYAVLPDDLVDVDAETFAYLIGGQTAGQMIVADNLGFPVLADRPPPDPAELRAGMSLSFAQLLTGLVAEEWISEAEGDAWLSGTLPAAVTALIATLPAPQRFAARARAARPSSVLRTDPLVAGLALATGKTDAELDAFFVGYAAI